MDLDRVVTDVADALAAIDSSRVPFRQFAPGVGPYGEPQVVRLVAEHLRRLEAYAGGVQVKRKPDLLVNGHWALEFKIVRPFGDNGKSAENWSVNLLHPYEGNVSSLGDCLKLRALECVERKAVVVIGYEHTPPKVDLAPLLKSFELVAAGVLDIALGSRVEARRSGLAHNVHQQLLVAAWEVRRPANDDGYETQ